MKKSCSERLIEAMHIRGLRQSELCQLTGIPKSAMSQYCKGAFEPKQTRLFALATALNVQIPWLMGYDVPMEKEDAWTNLNHLLKPAGYSLYGIDVDGSDLIVTEKGYINMGKEELASLEHSIIQFIRFQIDELGKNKDYLSLDTEFDDICADRVSKGLPMQYKK